MKRNVILFLLLFPSLLLGQNLFNQPENTVYDNLHTRWLISNKATGDIVQIDGQKFNNYPNPFTFSIEITFKIRKTSQNVLINKFDIRGRFINVLEAHSCDGNMLKTATWNGKCFTGSDVPPDQYIFSIDSEQNQTAGKTTLLR